MLLNPLNFHTPKTLVELRSLYGRLENVKLQAGGGTFLYNALKLLKQKGAKTPEHVISLRKVGELKGMTANQDNLIIKSMTNIDEIFDSPLLTDNFQVLKIVCRNISTQPIRNMATIGGNLTCRYSWTEMPAVMIGLEATMHFMGTNGQESSLPAEEFYNNAAKTDKILTHIIIKRDKQVSIAYRRVKKTAYVDIPLLSLIIKTTFEGQKFTNTRVAVNNCIDFAQRDKILENFLNLSQCSDGIAQEALDHLDKGS